MNRIPYVHFIGVAGVSMRALAAYSLNLAQRVSGSDREYDECFHSLREQGVEVWVGSNVEKIREATLVVYSAAIQQEDIELRYANEHGITTMERCEYLSYVSTLFDKTVAVAGTHGKTTVTAMLAHVFHSAGVKFAGHIGGESLDFNSNLVDEGSEIFLTEACEYRRSFLALDPFISVILNVDYDHPDSYSNYAELTDSFNEFIAKTAYKAVVNESVSTPSDPKIVKYGYSDGNDYVITNVRCERAKYVFDILSRGRRVTIRCPLYGRHNVLNCAAAYAVCDVLGIDWRAIESFNGVKRRFECKGKTVRGARVICDYAHHPREIQASINTARELLHGKLFVLFEPHTYSRTASLFDEFLECFFWADELLLFPTFSARESPEDGVASDTLFRALTAKTYNVLYMESYDDGIEYINRYADAGDTVLILGAGTIYNVGDALTVRADNSCLD